MSTNTGGLFSFTRLSKVVALVLVVGFVVQLTLPQTKEYLALVPGRFYPSQVADGGWISFKLCNCISYNIFFVDVNFWKIWLRGWGDTISRTLPCLWNLISSSFLETEIINLIFSVVSVLVLAKNIEPVYGSRGFLLFLLATAALTGVLTFMSCYAIYALERFGKVMYTQLSGFHGIVGGLLVGIKQISAEQQLTLFQVVKFKTKYLPLTYLILLSCVCIYFGKLYELMFGYYGVYSAWVYLRYFQQHAETSIRGDMSDEFRFATFFPPVVHPIADKISNIFGICCFCAPTGSNSGEIVHATAFSEHPQTSESARRRERGAKALQERLKQQMMKEAAALQTANGEKDVEAGQSQTQNAQ